ncbi:uncharacterized protein [Watersipora subatra]|uniref:uncharacterized protein n=1 Tax=Watersipora subatra TaxID=2589382 RepID=UPI00355B7466
MAELCQLWNVGKTHTTPYYPQTNGIVERNNQGLKDSLRTLLMARGQDKWNLLLLAEESIPRYFLLHDRRDGQHVDVGIGAEVAGPVGRPPLSTEYFPAHKHTLIVQRRLHAVHKALQQSHIEMRQKDREKLPLYAPDNWVWLTNKCRRRGENLKLQAQFVGPYQVLKAWGNHRYVVEW